MAPEDINGMAQGPENADQKLFFDIGYKSYLSM
jgi:hypothetical protein